MLLRTNLLLNVVLINRSTKKKKIYGSKICVNGTFLEKEKENWELMEKIEKTEE